MRSTDLLAAWVRDARRRTLEMVAGLSGPALVGPRLGIVNPVGWEIGHVAWFQERWVLRHAAGQAPARPDADLLWDSIAVPHDARWDLALPSLEATLAYMAGVEARVLRALEEEPDPRTRYFTEYTVYHEDMHDEAFAYTRQTLGYSAPPLPRDPTLADGQGPWTGDVEVAGGTFALGAEETEPFVFDNEKWAHAVTIPPFHIARAPVTAGEYAAFVDDGGYTRRAHWSDAGWAWREKMGAEHPLHWRRADGG